MRTKGKVVAAPWECDRAARILPQLSEIGKLVEMAPHPPSGDCSLLRCRLVQKAKGIFRINPENDQEEHVRDQLNKGVVPEGIGVHCLSSLIKAWFRELPGVLNGLSSEHAVLNGSSMSL